MPQMLEADDPDAGAGRLAARFGITETDAVAGMLRGTGDPVLDARGRPTRTIYVEILEPDTGRTWFAATRDWAPRGGLWHWSLDLSLAADTADRNGCFGRTPGAFEITAYAEDTDPRTGRLTTHLAAPRGLTVARRPQVAMAHTESVSVVLSRLRSLGERSPVHRPPSLSMLPEDRFVFVG